MQTDRIPKLLKITNSGEGETVDDEAGTGLTP
jgi:hypothetical protein